MHILIVKTCFYHISPTSFGVLDIPLSGRTSNYLHKTICFLLYVVYATLLGYRLKNIHYCRFIMFFTMIKTMFSLAFNIKNNYQNTILIIVQNTVNLQKCMCCNLQNNQCNIHNIQ